MSYTFDPKSRLTSVFAADNARNQYEADLPATFIPTPIYYRLLCEKNQILVGARGSGKTAVLKMLSHPYLSRFNNEQAQRVVHQRSYIGVYVPVTAMWVGAIKSRPWPDLESKERDFVWAFCIALCQALTDTTQSCLNAYVPETAQRLRLTVQFIEAFRERWLPDAAPGAFRSLLELRDALAEVLGSKSVFDASQYVSGLPVEQRALFNGSPQFASSALAPFFDALQIVRRLLDMPAPMSSWFICVDEVETLDPEFQRILNTFMRAQATDAGGIFFKIALMPYDHKTLETNLAKSLQVGHDFEYLWIADNAVRDDAQRAGAVRDASSASPMFARRLFNARRAYLSDADEGADLPTLEKLLGHSAILSPIEFASKRDEAGRAEALSRFLILARDHFDPKTLERAQRKGALERELVLGDPDEEIEEFEEEKGFEDQILRKTYGFLLLRDAHKKRRGSTKLGVYSGAEMVIRLADGNARTLVRLLNALMQDPDWRRRRTKPRIPETRQHEILTDFSQTLLGRLRHEDLTGPDLFSFVSELGNGLHKLFYAGRIGSDHVGQIKVSNAEFEAHEAVIKSGIALGVLMADVKRGSEFVLPQGACSLRLSYALAPTFELMPRKGRGRNLQTVLAGREGELFDEA